MSNKARSRKRKQKTKDDFIVFIKSNSKVIGKFKIYK